MLASHPSSDIERVILTFENTVELAADLVEAASQLTSHSWDHYLEKRREKASSNPKKLHNKPIKL